MNQPAARYFHVSNLLTYVSVLSGLCAIFAAHTLQSWSAAGGFIALCAFADMFDGKFANLFSRSKSLKKFGTQFDSLSDALSFGLVPVACLLELLHFESFLEYFLWGAAAFFYITCAVTRLGVYNINEDDVDCFIGLPTTIAALVWSSAFVLRVSTTFSTILFVVLGVAMISSISIRRPKTSGMIILLLWIILLLGLHGMGI